MDDYYDTINHNYQFLTPSSQNKHLYNSYASEAKRLFNIFEDMDIPNSKGAFLEIPVVLPRHKVDPGKLRDNNISFQYQGNDVIIYLGALLDTGADNSYIHDSVTQAIDLEHLSSLLNHTHIGISGKETKTFERVGVPVRDCLGYVNVCNFKITHNYLGIEAATPQIYRTNAMKSLGISPDLKHNFNFYNSPKDIHMLLGVDNTFCLPREIDPEVIGLKVPVSSPQLKIMQTNLSRKIMVLGPLGISPELFNGSSPVFFVPNSKKKNILRKFFLMWEYPLLKKQNL